MTRQAQMAGCTVLTAVLSAGIACGQDTGSIVAWGSEVVGVDLRSGFVAVAGGHRHGLGVKIDGSIVAWGFNGSGQCNVPVPNSDFVGAAGGWDHSLGLKADGSIAAWGCAHPYSDFGQCNVPGPNANFVAVAAGAWHSLGLRVDGSIVAWGRDTQGQCNVPEPNADFVAIAGGWVHSLGLKADGTVVAWGANYDGQCNVPDPNADFVAIAAGWGHSLGLKANGSIVAWGRNNYGERDVPEPNSDFVDVAAGSYHSLGLKVDGSIEGWGAGEAGESGSSFDQGQCDVPTPNSGFVAIAGGGEMHSLGLKGDGSIVAWGNNGTGQLNIPEPNSDFVTLATGGHVLALKANGSIVAWGDHAYNETGQCDVPEPNSNFVGVAAGLYHSLGLKGDNSIVAWGDNLYGQCDVPDPNSDFVGVAAGRCHSLGLKGNGSIVGWGCAADGDYGQCDVPEYSDFVGVAGGWHHSLGLRGDGSIVAWGDNWYGQCDVPPYSDFVGLSAGCYHSLGVRADGSIVAWGCEGAYEDWGQCDVPPDTDFVRVVTGESHSVALKVDGSIVPWGRNDYGQCDVPAPNGAFAAIGVGYFGYTVAVRDEDCNDNGILDTDDLANCDGSQWCDDCNANGVLDYCECPHGWAQRTPLHSPSARWWHATAYDEVTHETVLFGGWDGVSVLGDTWVWDGTDWTDVSPLPPASSPDPRTRHGMVYDSLRNVIVLFGGTTGSLNDETWEWDGQTRTWTLVATGGPTPRREFGFAFDSFHNVALLYGGIISAGRAQDTWAWNGVAWTQLLASSPPSFLARQAMAFDPSRNVVVMFGGAKASEVLSNETWEWDGGTWVQRFPAASPSARRQHAMSFHAMNGRVMLFGGDNGSVKLGDTWSYDGPTWNRISSTGPSARDLTALAYDATRAEMVLFGGRTGDEVNNETWIYRDGCPDCNGNEHWDVCDITADHGGLCIGNYPVPPHGPGPCSGDCQPNGIPDECELGLLPLWAWGGELDDFALPSEDAIPGAVLQQFIDEYGQVEERDFDEGGANKDFGHTFEQLPADIVDIELEAHLAVLSSGADNDTISLQATGDAHFWWGRYIGTYESDPGLVGGPWLQVGEHTIRMWLSELPNPDGSTTNLIPRVIADGRVDIYSQDDTAVDYILLHVFFRSSPTSQDCNLNGVPDECDIADGVSDDCQPNGVPDECIPPELDCNANDIPDECDIDDGTSVDCNQNEIPDECECFAVEAPGAEVPTVAKNRYLSFVPANAGCRTALRVKLTSLGYKYWVGALWRVTETSGSAESLPEPAFWAAGLECNPQPQPHCDDWGQKGLIHVLDESIIPGATYDIQAIACACDRGVESNYSAALSVGSSKWGDIVGNCYPPTDPLCVVNPANNYKDCCTPPQGTVNFVDISCMVDKFRNQPGAPSKSRADVALRDLDTKIDFKDIPAVVDAFKGGQYPYAGPDPCP